MQSVYLSACRLSIMYIKHCASMRGAMKPILIPRQGFLTSHSYKLTLTRCVQSSAGDKHSMSVAATSSNANLKDFSEIPGPLNFPVIGALPSLIRHGFDSTQGYVFWEKLFVKYGPLVKLKLPGLPIFVVTKTPEDIEAFMKSTVDNPIREGMLSLKQIREKEPNNYFNKKGGILTENNEEWWRVRSRVQAPLLKPKNVAQYLHLVDEATLTFMERIDMLQKDKGRVPDDFLEELYKWALECVGLVALDKKLGCLEPNLAQDSVQMQMIRNINQVLRALNETEMNFQWWRFFKTKAYTDLENAHGAFLSLADQSINAAMQSLMQAQAKGDPKRTLTVMETYLQIEGLSKSDVATMVLDMLFAGVDTTSHTVAFTLYLLAKNPKVQKKLHDEIDQVMGDSPRLLPEHINEMKYLKRVLKESLRLYPLAIAVGRTTTREIPMSGYRIPPGCMAMGVSILTSRDGQYFQRPEEFIPERWGRDRPLGPIHPFASIPFSFGTRMCIGKRIAEQEIYNFIIRTMQRYTITFESDQLMKIKTQMVVKPMIPLAFKFHPRY